MNRISYRTITTIKNTEKTQVHLASMEGRDEPVVIKRMNTANPEVYRALSEIYNVHIPRIYDWECQENELVVAEEYVDGETLEHFLKEDLLTEAQKLDIALQLCEAVEVLHNCVPQVIHRDIKPSNILITEEGVLKLIDYDAARQYKQMGEDSDTRILGTADYAAPEQFGYKQTDVRSDIYSMGIVFKLLQFQGNTLATLAWKQLQDICTSFDPKKRYKSVDAVANAISRVMVLQKYQWYGLGAVICTVLLLGFSMFGIQKPTNEEIKPPNTQAPSVSQESEMSGVTDFDGLELEKIESIKQKIELNGWTIYEYFQGERDIDLFFYSDFFENDIKVLQATLTDMVSGECIVLEDNCRIENSIFMIDNAYMQTLQPSYYKLEMLLLDQTSKGERGYSVCINVISEKESFVENEYMLETNYLDYNYEQYDRLHIIVCTNTKYKIKRIHLVNYGPIDPENYQILYDGRAAELSAVLLEQCKNASETLFEVEFNNGERERLIIANPYLR